MEENIKILEKLIDKKYTKNLLEIVSVFTEKDKVSVLSEKEIQAIQNLITRYKELEEDKKELQKYIKDYLIPKSVINLVYIPKSKVKEKIEEIDNTGIRVCNEQLNYQIKLQDEAKKEVLQELLEES